IDFQIPSPPLSKGSKHGIITNCYARFTSRQPCLPNPGARVQPVTQVTMNSRVRISAGVTVLIVLFAIQLALTSHANTITWDEPDHIYSGYMAWKGDFGLNPHNPTLIKLLA